MNINKKLSQNGEHETAAGIDLFKSSNTGDLEYKDRYGKTVTIADQAYVKKSMQEAVDNIQDGFTLDFKKGSVGPKVSFTKANGADIFEPQNRDIIIPGVLEITRGNDGGGIFNYAVEEDFNSSSPQYTYWNTQFIDATNTTWAPLIDIENRSFDTWKNAVLLNTGFVPPQYVGLKTVMQFQDPDSGNYRYWLIEFTYWGIGEEGDFAFSYDRYEILNFVEFEQQSVADLSIPLSIDIISDGVHLARNYDDFSLHNAVVESYNNSGVSPKNTRWNSIFTDPRPGYNQFKDLTNLKSRVYSNFYSALDGDIPNNISGLELIMHDLTTDLYWKFVFNNWQSGGEAGGVGSFTTLNAGVYDLPDGDYNFTGVGGSGNDFTIYTTITGGVPNINAFWGGSGYTEGDTISFDSEFSEEPTLVIVESINYIGGFSYIRQVIPQGDAVKFADGTELDTAPSNAGGHEIVIDSNGNTIVDDTSNNLVYIPEGMHPEDFKQNIDSFSGMLLVNDHFDGGVETWICGGGDCTLISSTSASGGGGIMVMNGGGYDWQNPKQLKGPFTFTVIKTRQGS